MSPEWGSGLRRGCGCPGCAMAPLGPALQGLLTRSPRRLPGRTLYSSVCSDGAGILGLRGGGAGAQVGAPVTAELGSRGRAGRAPGVLLVPTVMRLPALPLLQGPFCLRDLFLHGGCWERGVDPLPPGASRAEGVSFPKQAGTGVGG